MTNEQNPIGEALSQEEMDLLAQQVIPATQKSTVVNTDVITAQAIKLEDVTKISANPETVRLPDTTLLTDTRDSDGPATEPATDDRKLINSEVLHEEVKVGEPDYSYKPKAPIDDSVTPEFQTFLEKKEATEASAPAQEAVTSTQSEPPTSGLIIENKKEESVSDPIAGMSRDSQNNLEDYLANMESDMSQTKDMRDTFSQFNPNLAPIEGQNELIKEDTHSGELLTQKEQKSDRETRAKEAIVIIDKLEAHNLKFTEEERAKLEKADVIKLKEVKTVDLKTTKKRRGRKDGINVALMRKGNTIRTTNILAPASGYYAEMGGCSPYEIMTLQNEEDPITDNQVKWKLIYDKINSNSIGFKTYEEFMEVTAVADYESFIWGILRSTFEDVDKISLNCQNPECLDSKKNRTSFEFSYSILGLLRAEEIDEKLNGQISRVVDAKTLDAAKEAHNLAPVNDILAIQLNDSGAIFEICINSVNGFINNTLESLSDEDLEPHKRQAAVLATTVREVGILAADGEHDWYDGQADITDAIYHLSANDLVVLANKVQEHTGNVSFKFGFIDVTCPKCKHYTEFQPMEVDTILFYQNALSMNVSVE